MLYALKEGHKIKALPKQEAICIGCNEIVKSFCGDIYVWHWKHNQKVNCDEWHETETKWHLDWKNFFGIDNTEIRITKNEKWHIADVYTDSKVVIELQYSPIDKRVIEKREEFYGEKMLWLLHQRHLEIKPLELDKFYFDRPLAFTTYFDVKEFGFPVWIADFLQFEISEGLIKSLKNNGFIFDITLNKYYKRSSYRTCRRWGFEADIKKDLVREIILFSREIMKLHPSYKKFSLWRTQKTWSYSKRNIFIDNLSEKLIWVKTFKNDRYGLIEHVSKSNFISKYSKINIL